MFKTKKIAKKVSIFMFACVLASTFLFSNINIDSNVTIAQQPEQKERICDLNDDGKETLVDALLILRHMVKITEIPEEKLQIADVNYDGKISTIDPLLLMKKIAGFDAEIPITAPVATGSFIQPWMSAGWTQSKWDSHIDMLLSAGIDKLVIQWTVGTDDNKYGLVTYDSPSMKDSSMKDPEKYSFKPNMLERALSSAERKGMKVFVGLNSPDDWWDETKMTSKDWYTSNAEIGNTIMKETYDLYKEKYPNAFYGWYWVCEMYSQNQVLEKYWSEMMNINLDYATTLDPSMPMLFSPFVSSYTNITPEESYTQWSNFMKTTRFRKGDIFCPQDSYGASGYSLDFLEEHIKMQKKACEFNENITFWLNCENFTKDGKPASVKRFIKQLRMASKYADEIITFSYCHYYNPSLNFEDYDLAYKEYVKSLNLKK